MNITYDDFIRVVQEHDGEVLKTAGGRAVFRLQRTAHGVSFTPKSSGKRRPVNRKSIESFLDVYNRTHSIVTSHYTKTFRHPSYVLAIIKLILGQQPDTPVDQLAGEEEDEDCESIRNRQDIDTTTKDALISSRRGQGRFRTEVLRRWGNRCSVTQSGIGVAIRASHIKPWRDAEDEERLDPNNGLPLIANLDALFDAGLISFESSGRMVVSPQLNTSERQILGIGELSLTKPPNAETVKYLSYHRDNKFKKQG